MRMRPMTADFAPLYPPYVYPGQVADLTPTLRERWWVAHLLNPPYIWTPRPRRSVALRRPTWIPASAGMTEGQAQGPAPTETCRDGAAGRCRGLGCPQVSFISPKIGGQGVETRTQRQRWWAQPTLRDGDGGLPGHDKAWPSEDRRGFPPAREWQKGRHGGLPLRRLAVMVQRDAAGGLGVPFSSLLFPQEWGPGG